MFSEEYWKIFQNNYSAEHLQTKFFWNISQELKYFTASSYDT